jgi:translation elongation factor EF-4
MAKLVLDIEPEVIDTLNKVAEKKHQTVSQVAENLFRNAGSEELNSIDVKAKLGKYSEWIQRLVIADKPTPDFDHKAEYGKHLEEKYGL